MRFFNLHPNIIVWCLDIYSLFLDMIQNASLSFPFILAIDYDQSNSETMLHHLNMTQVTETKQRKKTQMFCKL